MQSKLFQSVPLVCLSEQLSRAAETGRCLLNKNKIYILQSSAVSTYYRPGTCPNTLYTISYLILVAFEIGAIIYLFIKMVTGAQGLNFSQDHVASTRKPRF